MIGRTNVCGTGKVFAFIVVTYPEGSVCTCYDDNRTLRAKGTTGSFVFVIPYAGTWTVKCENGTDSDSTDVTITMQGESISIELKYGLILYKNGYENPLVGSDGFVSYATSGYSKGGFVKNETDMTITANGSGRGTTVKSGNKISIDGFTKLKFALSETTASRTRAGLSNSGNGSDGLHPNVLEADINEIGDNIIDISNVTSGEYYITILTWNSNNEPTVVKEISLLR